MYRVAYEKNGTLCALPRLSDETSFRNSSPPWQVVMLNITWPVTTLCFQNCQMLDLH